LPRPYLFHIRPQEASVLLGPACDDLDRIRLRLTHYADHIRLSDDDAIRMRKAADAISVALGAIQWLRAGDVER
jgi:hypothetical protein